MFVFECIRCFIKFFQTNSNQKKSVPRNFFHGTDCKIHICGTTHIGAKRPLCTHHHALRRDNGRGCRRVLLALPGFLPALVSPFTAHSAAALPPMRRSLKVSCAPTPLTQRFLKYKRTLARFSPLVKHFFQLYSARKNSGFRSRRPANAAAICPKRASRSPFSVPFSVR